MTIKKGNAVCSWITSLILLGHATTMILLLFTGWYSVALGKALAHSMAGMVCIHALLSIIIVFFSHDGANFSRYTRYNRGTVLQRASSLVLVILLHFHMGAFDFIASGTTLSTGNKITILITEILFFGAVFSHLAVSFGRSFLSVGLIRRESTLKIIDRSAYIVSGVYMLLTVLGLIKFIVTWTGFAG